MIDKLDGDRLNELAEFIVQDYLAKQNIPPSSVVCVDIEGLAKDYFGYDILFENIKENDLGKIAFSANGVRPITVSRNGRKERIVFPADKIILDRYYQRTENYASRRFAIGHELGHKILSKVAPEHSRGNYQTIFDSERQYTAEELHSQMNLVEVQANQMSAALQLPMFLLRSTLNRVINRRKFPVYGDFQMLPEDSMLLKRMADDLGVSTKTLIIRLRNCNLIEYRPIEEFMKRIDLRGDGSNVYPG